MVYNLHPILLCAKIMQEKYAQLLSGLNVCLCEYITITGKPTDSRGLHALQGLLWTTDLCADQSLAEHNNNKQKTKTNTRSTNIITNDQPLTLQDKASRASLEETHCILHLRAHLVTLPTNPPECSHKV